VTSRSRTDGPRSVEPFVIWMMRDSRARLLALWLAQCGRPRPLAVDPFTPGSGWHALPAITDPDVKPVELQAALSQVLAERPVIVHCVDDLDESFQIALATAASKVKYRHLILVERLPLERLLLQHARRQAEAASMAQAPADEPAPADPARIEIERVAALLQHARTCHKRLAWVRHALRLRGHARRTEVFENLFDDRDTPTEQRRRWREMLDSIGVPAAEEARLDTWIAAAPKWDPEVSRAPRLQPEAMRVLKRELTHLPGFEVQQSFLHPTARVSGDPRGDIRIFRLGGLPPFVDEGDALAVGGTAIAAAGVDAAQIELLVDAGFGAQPLKWPLPSPAIATQIPEEPQAGNARFRAPALAASARRPWAFSVRRAGAGLSEVARLHFKAEPKARMSGVFVAGWSIGYQPVTGAASRAILQALFELGNGYPFTAEAADGESDAVRFFESRIVDVSGAWFRFTVVRDPVARFILNFQECVVRQRALSLERLSEGRGPKATLKMAKLADPSLDTFVDRFDTYLRLPLVQERFRPLADFLAPLADFDAVYRTDELARLRADIQERVHRAFALRPSDVPEPVVDVDAGLRSRIEKRCESDLQLLQSRVSNKAPSGPASHRVGPQPDPA
jgi:hypothetical protein